MRDRYVSVSLPEGLTRQLERFVGKRGYASLTEIVKEASRFRFEQLVKHQRRLARS
jgi:metal-responsive CopG/Arc/MetJ family transcriptional regulator